MKRIALASTMVFAIGGQAHAERQWLTPSGQPDAIFKGTPLASTAGKLANGCMNAGWQVVSQGSNQLVCEIQMGALDAAITQAFIGNQFSTKPRTFVRFSLAEIDGDTRSQATSWVETQMAFGQMRQQPFADDGTADNLQTFLIASGGQFPTGTRRTGSYVGLDPVPEVGGRLTYMTVANVLEGSPAANAGLKPGDMVTKVNGEKFKSHNHIRKMLLKIAPGDRYSFDVKRDGVNITIWLVAQSYPVVGTPEWSAMEAATVASRARLQ